MLKLPSGSLSICNDISMISSGLTYNTKVLYVGELNNNINGVIPFSILLPPYQALEAEINGDMEMYSRFYTSHLMLPECMEAVAMIAASIWSGNHVVLLIENGGCLQHMQFLLNHFINNFGLIPATPNTPFQFNTEFSTIIATLLFYYTDLVSPNDYIKELQDVNVLVNLNNSVFNGRSEERRVGKECVRTLR